MWKENLKSGSGGMLRWAAAPAFCCKMGAYLTGKTGKHRFPTGCPSGRLTGLCPVFTTAGEMLCDEMPYQSAANSGGGSSGRCGVNRRRREKNRKGLRLHSCVIGVTEKT